MFRGTRALVALALIAATSNAALPKPKPYQWTPVQANAAIMRQSENFYIEQLDGYTQVRDLVSSRLAVAARARVSSGTSSHSTAR